jgi:hypothetical protein
MKANPQSSALALPVLDRRTGVPLKDQANARGHFVIGRGYVHNISAQLCYENTSRTNGILNFNE